VSTNVTVEVYDRLLTAFGPQHWWPGRTPFEVMVGAILTQNTSWKNVELAIGNLRASGRLDPFRLRSLPTDELALLIRPSGYYNLKARRLQAFLVFFVDGYRGSASRMGARETRALREELLTVSGIGPETADSILLYALGHAVFVVDAYTRRIFSRLGLVDETSKYQRLQAEFMGALPQDAALYNEYHALIVALGKDVCRPRPHCAVCPLMTLCPAAKAQQAC
jgi:endonuclease-3 related protein